MKWKPPLTPNQEWAESTCGQYWICLWKREGSYMAGRKHKPADIIYGHFKSFKKAANECKRRAEEGI